MKKSNTLPNSAFYIAAVIIGAALAFLTCHAEAREKHHRNTSVTNIENITNKYDVSGRALSAGLAAIDCDYTTRKWQGGIGMGFYDGIGAPVAGICKKSGAVLIKLTVGRENETTAGNIGFMAVFE